MTQYDRMRDDQTALAEHSSPMVTAVIVNWNRWNDTLECIDSLLRTEYPNKKIIIVDNGSIDDSSEKIAEWLSSRESQIPWFRRVLETSNPIDGLCGASDFRQSISQGEFVNREDDIGSAMVLLVQVRKNFGYASGANLGAIVAELVFHPEYVLILNNDTLVDSESISSMVTVAERRREYGIVAPFVYDYDDRMRLQSAGGRINMWSGRRIPIDLRSSNLPILDTIDVEYASGVALMVRADVFSSIGYLDIDYFMYTEDIDFCYRATRRGFKIAVIPKAIIWHKLSASSGGASSGFSDYHIYRNAFLFMQKNARWYHWPTFVAVSIVWGLVRLTMVAISEPVRAKSMVSGAAHGLIRLSPRRRS